jgi:hypothetical protein
VKAACTQLLPQHDVYPQSPRADRYTLVAFAAACLLMAIFAGPVGTDTVALVVVSGVLLFRAWQTRDPDNGETHVRKPRE